MASGPDPGSPPKPGRRAFLAGGLATLILAALAPLALRPGRRPTAAPPALRVARFWRAVPPGVKSDRAS